jgi:hypothetical protein
MECECGLYLARGITPRHLSSQRHQRRMRALHLSHDSDSDDVRENEHDNVRDYVLEEYVRENADMDQLLREHDARILEIDEMLRTNAVRLHDMDIRIQALAIDVRELDVRVQEFAIRVNNHLNCDTSSVEMECSQTTCTICTQLRTIFIPCHQCSNMVCRECFRRVRPRNKCPFCRCTSMASIR